MTPLDRKLLRDVQHAKGLLFAISSIIAVGVMCFVTLRSSYENLNDAMNRFYDDCRMADFWIDLKKVPASEVERLESFPGIAQLDARIRFYALVDLPDSREPINGLVISMPDRRQQVLNDFILMSGEYFSDSRDNEVIVNAEFAEANGIYPGREIHLMLNNRRERVIVAGTATSSEFCYLLGPGSLLPDPTSFGVFYVKQTYAEEVYDFAGAANQISGRMSPEANGNVEVLLDQLETELESFGVLTTYPRKRQVSHSFLENEINGLESIATIMPIIFLAVAALILNVLVTRLVRQQRTMIGTLKALGYDHRDILLHFLKLGSIVGAAGGLAGSIGGFVLSMLMTWFYADYFVFPELRTGFHFYTHLIGMASSISCAMLGSAIGARTAVRLEPAEAMRPAPPAKGGAIWLERVPWVWGHLSASWRLTFRSIWRGRIRSVMTVFSTMMGAALLVAGFNLYESQGYLIDFQFQRINRSDLELSFQDTLSSSVMNDLNQLPGVDYVEPIFDVPCTLINGSTREKIGIQGIRQDARLTVPRDQQGDPIRMPSSGLILGRRLAQKLRVEAGESVTLLPSIGTREAVQVTVAAVVDSYIGLIAYGEIEYLAGILHEENIMSRAQLALDHDPTHEEQLYRELKQMPQIQSVTDRRELIASINEVMLESQWVMFAFIVGFAGVIFLGSVVNSMMVSLAERSREIATFRAIGYTEWQIGGVFLRESFTMAMLGTVLGFPVGHGICILMAWGLNSDLTRLPVVYADWGIPVALVLAIVFVGLAHAIVQRAINRANLLEALNVKE